jgi:pantoate--beta-alanine ligase
MDTVSTIAAVRERVRAWHREGLRVAFVPTMGNLHAGHMSLIETARRHGQRFVASIFVNPMQFGPNEDFAHYPRTPREDERMLAAAGCDLMFMPDVAEIYPRGSQHATRVEVPELSRTLCGEFRPGHFEGVTTIVATLLHIVEPDIAVFGEKDFQQLTLIRRMVVDLCMPVQIVGAPTVRDTDGLAMSSRNQYLTAAERAVAPGLYAALQAAAQRLAGGDRDFVEIERAGTRALQGAGFRPDYFSVRRAQDLLPPDATSRDLVVLTAARLGKARLIDNVQVSVPLPAVTAQRRPAG